MGKAGCNGHKSLSRGVNQSGERGFKVVSAVVWHKNCLMKDVEFDTPMIRVCVCVTDAYNFVF